MILVFRQGSGKNHSPFEEGSRGQGRSPQANLGEGLRSCICDGPIERVVRRINGMVSEGSASRSFLKERSHRHGFCLCSLWKKTHERT